MDDTVTPFDPQRDPAPGPAADAAEDLDDLLDPLDDELDDEEDVPGWSPASLFVWTASPLLALLRRFRRTFSLRECRIARIGGQTAIARRFGPFARGRCALCPVGRAGGMCLVLLDRDIADADAPRLRCDAYKLESHWKPAPHPALAGDLLAGDPAEGECRP